jgi:peptide/nickel transport system permease protein
MKDFQLVVLWSDVLFAVLICALAAGVSFAMRREHLRRAWHGVFSRPSAMASLVILLCYLLIAIIDSVHYRPALEQKGEPVAGARVIYSVEVKSLLDVVLAGMRETTEKSYSEPFAAYLYEKQVMEQPDGSQRRDYPRLQFGSAHLADPANERAGDIAVRLSKATLVGVGLWLLALGAIARGVGKRQGMSITTAAVAVLRGRTAIAWDGFAWTLLGVLVFGSALMMLSGPYHVFGTDATGNDVLYQTFKAMRTALMIGTLATLVVLPLGIGLGIAAGYYGGWVDDAIQYVYTVISSIPYVLLIAAAALMMQMVIEGRSDLFDTAAARADARLVSLCVIIGTISWTTLCRLLRADVQAARCFGVSNLRIMLRHILPNAFHIVLITVVIEFSALVLAEAVLSYVGVGVDPTTFSFGNMINKARGELAREPAIWWSITSAFVFMVSLVLAANLFADAVRDAFDPRALTPLRRRLRLGAAK